MLRFLTAGESHGPAEIAILEGIPAGLPLSLTDIQKDLDRRKSGAGRGGRGLIEKDQAKILSGVRNSLTLGSPIAISVINLDHVNWQDKMDAVSSKNPDKITNPRPGHADLPGSLKYHFSDIRNVIERASARETIMKVAVGAICRKLLNEFDIKIGSHTLQIGKIKLHREKYKLADIFGIDQEDPLIRCIDKIDREKMAKEIIKATKNKDTLGGVVEIVVHNIPPGLGSYVHYDRKIDGLLAQALMSIPSVKAVEIGQGTANSGKLGSQVQDEIHFTNNKFLHKTNNAGGIEGGVTNGEDIILKVFHKPISTLGKPLSTVDIHTKKVTTALVERSDICVVPRAGVVGESMAAFVLANAMLEKFGSDTVSEIKRNYKSYLDNILP